MELKKHPVTEMEYWQAIESCGGIAWSLNHDLTHGRIDKNDKGAAIKDIRSAQEISQRLVREIEKKFNVIPPDKMPEKVPGQELPAAPEGKKWYWDWYNEMKLKFHQQEYDGLICSACPYTHGVEWMASINKVPCSLFSGSLYRLRKPWICGQADPAYSRDMKPIELYARILNEHGVDTLVAFRQKEIALSANPQPNSFAH